MADSNTNDNESSNFIKYLLFNSFIAFFIVFPVLVLSFLGGSILVSYHADDSRSKKIMYFILGFILNILVLFWFIYTCKISKKSLPIDAKAFDIF